MHFLKLHFLDTTTIANDNNLQCNYYINIPFQFQMKMGDYKL